MMVGTYGTSVGASAPRLGSTCPVTGFVTPGSGTHDGSDAVVPPGVADHRAVPPPESQPHPDGVWAPPAGLEPVKPSVDAATAYRCPNHDGLSCMENVLSLMAKEEARAAMFGSCDGMMPLTQAYPVLDWQPGMLCQPFILPPLMAAT